jgi:hypothetical protein
VDNSSSALDRLKVAVIGSTSRMTIIGRAAASRMLGAPMIGSPVARHSILTLTRCDPRPAERYQFKALSLEHGKRDCGGTIRDEGDHSDPRFKPEMTQIAPTETLGTDVLADFLGAREAYHACPEVRAEAWVHRLRLEARG